jgi:hypothetical protein
MRRWLTTALLLLLAVCCAHGAEPVCGHPHGGSYSAEWMEGGEPRGARIVAVDPKWGLIGSLDTLGNAFCETCEGDQFRAVHLWLWARDSAGRNLDEEVSPESLAELMMVRQMPPAEFRANSDPVPVTIAGLEGKARKIGIRCPNGRSDEAIILSAFQGCLSLSVIAWARDGVAIPFERIGELASAISIQRYRPAWVPCRPLKVKEIPLLEQLQPQPSCWPPADDSK